MSRNSFAISALLFLTLAPVPVSAQLKVSLSMPTVAITEIPFKIAQVKGFYREGGLEVEMIVIRGALGVTALLGGSVDYTTASGAIIAAAVRGIGTKLVLLIDSKPAFKSAPSTSRGFSILASRLKASLKPGDTSTMSDWNFRSPRRVKPRYGSMIRKATFSPCRK